MKSFLNENFMLHGKTAERLYHDYAKKMPIVDYHCHINPEDIARDKSYETITELWLGGDHYKWRAMRSAGVQEELITGQSDPREKFLAWANTIPGLIGNPLYHWTHLELKRYFGIDEPLCGKNADYVYDKCNDILKNGDMSVRSIIQKSNVNLICTTDDPIDSLDVHKYIADDATCKVAVLPAFRPDKAFRADKPEFANYIQRLENLTGSPISTVEQLCDALCSRIDYFDQRGCRVADHALDTCICTVMPECKLNEILNKGLRGEALTRTESEAFQTRLLLACAGEYRKRNWVMQLHFGCIRNNSSKMFERLGPDTGYDAANDEGSNAVRLSGLLDLLEKADSLPKTILYSLNPADLIVMGTVMGSFQTNSPVPGRIQMGSAWWFNDHKIGMETQLTTLMNLGYIGSFVGMLTDSRSFLSYTRHEYFRRILCNLFGNIVDNGEYPMDLEQLGPIVENICYNNALRYFRFDEIIE